jgi:hypothetical protein
MPNTFAAVGSALVTVALLCYSAAIFLEQTKGTLTRTVLVLLTSGAFFDITATACMIAGSSRGPFTLHALLGYSSLVLMLVAVVICWRLSTLKGKSLELPRSTLVYSRIAFVWWIVAYVSGAAIVLMR